MTPTPSFQKNLIIVLSGFTLRRDIESKSACWLLPRDDAWTWLKERRSLFPRSSFQKQIALAILPEDLRASIACTMCDGQFMWNGVNLGLCRKPEFFADTSTSITCLMTVTSYGGAKELRTRFLQASALIAKQIELSIPAATRFPNGFFNEHAGHAEAAMLARIDQIALGTQVPPPSLPSKARASKPRL